MDHSDWPAAGRLSSSRTQLLFHWDRTSCGFLLANDYVWWGHSGKPVALRCGIPLTCNFDLKTVNQLGQLFLETVLCSEGLGTLFPYFPLLFHRGHHSLRAFTAFSGPALSKPLSSIGVKEKALVWSSVLQEALKQSCARLVVSYSWSM